MTSCAISANGKVLCLGDNRGMVTALNLTTGVLVLRGKIKDPHQNPAGAVTRLTISDDGTTIAAGTALGVTLIRKLRVRMEDQNEVNERLRKAEEEAEWGAKGAAFLGGASNADPANLKEDDDGTYFSAGGLCHQSQHLNGSRRQP